MSKVYYKLNTNANGTSISDLAKKLELASVVPGIKKENQQFHLPLHHEARIGLLVKLVPFNRNKGFTKEIFNSALHYELSTVGFDPEYPEKHLAGVDVFQEWLDKDIIAPIEL